MRRLLVSGRLVSDPTPTLERLGLGDAIDLVGRYRQSDAPDVFRRAHVLLHTKVNDPCPTTVIEALACGVPVVYAASGGTVELVADEGGVGVPHPAGYERDEPPAPEALAAAVGEVLADRASYARGSAAPGRRAVRARRLARPARRVVRGARVSATRAAVAQAGDAPS